MKSTTEDRAVTGRRYQPVTLTGRCQSAVDITATSARERGTGERRDAGAGNGGTSRIAARRLTLTGGADRVGVRMPGTRPGGQHLLDRGQAAHAHRRGLAGCPSSGQPTLTGGADRVGVRLPGVVGSGQHLPDRSQAADAHRRGRSCERPDAWGRGTGMVTMAASTCRIAAKRLTLTGGAGPDAGVACGTLCPTSYSVARTSRAATPWLAPAGSRPGYAHRRCLSCGRPDAWGRGRRPAHAGSRPVYAHRRGRLCGRPDAWGRGTGMVTMAATASTLPDRGHRRCRSCGRPGCRIEASG